LKPGWPYLRALVNIVAMPFLPQSVSTQIQRAHAARLASGRIAARSAQLVASALASVRNAIQSYDRAVAIQAKWDAPPRLGVTPAAAWAWADWVRPLPLTPPRLLEIAQEFRHLAEHAATPEVSEAFHGLAFRYTAMAGGFDTEAMPSRRLH
jgi:hypothetical protein